MDDCIRTSLTMGKPVKAVVSLSDVKSSLAIDHNDDDAVITRQINSARVMAEKFTGKAFGERTCRLSLSGWPKYGRFEFPVLPVKSVTAFSFKDASEVTNVVDLSQTVTWLDANPPTLNMKLGFSYPTLTLNGGAGIFIDFIAGDDDDAAGDFGLLGEAIKLTIAFWRDPKAGGQLDAWETRGLPVGATSILTALWTGAN